MAVWRLPSAKYKCNPLIMDYIFGTGFIVEKRGRLGREFGK
jgi:hypothetical protein